LFDGTLHHEKNVKLLNYLEMKTQKIISVKAVTKVLLVITLIILNACNGRQENPDKQKRISSVTQNNPKPPEIDIHTATVLGDLEAIRQHIKAGSDLNIKEPEGGSTPLITAAVFGRTEVAETLIEAGADVNSINNDGSTPLYCAAFFCRTEIVRALLDKGADKNIKNNFGLTALESVSAPFNDVRVIYDLFSKELGQLGFKLDYDQLRSTRPMIAEILK
jgi:ankyrin repeat protein